jgi:hypothetical protein
MARRSPRAIGTAAESAVVATARALGFPEADRRALHGRADVGDILLCRGVVLEVKGGQMARAATDGDVERWLLETEHERAHAGAEVGLLVVQRAGVGPARATMWWAWWRLGWLAVPGADGLVAGAPVRMHLGAALGLLRARGYPRGGP